MPFVRLIRNDESEKNRHRLAIRRVEWNGKFRSHEHAGCARALAHARVRDGNTVTHTGGAHLFARYEALENDCLGEAVPRGKQGGDLFEELGFVRYVEVQTDVIKTQYFTEWIHCVCPDPLTRARR